MILHAALQLQSLVCDRSVAEDEGLTLIHGCFPRYLGASKAPYREQSRGQPSWSGREQRCRYFLETSELLKAHPLWCLEMATSRSLICRPQQGWILVPCFSL